MAAEESALLQNLLLFGRLLRSIGIGVTSAQMVTLLDALAAVGIGRREDVKNTARALLINRREDIAPFDRAFDAFFQAWSDAPNPEDSPLTITQQIPNRSARNEPRGPEGSGSQRSGRDRGLARRGAQENQEGEEDRLEITAYSAGERLRTKDFALFDEEELSDARRFLGSIRWDMTRRRSRRVRPTRHGKTLDVRRSLRRNMRHGGELLELSRRGPKLKRRRLVLLCDISGSMERYTRLLLHFLHSVEASERRSEVFLFGTRLTRVTPALRRRDPDAALAAVSSQVRDWSGGTRIGETLRNFNRRWARRVLGQGAIVLIISDGWDRGEPEVLAAEMARLQRSSYRLIWLNPLLGSPGYRPLTQGIQAALPYVDTFLPVHNLQSLEELAALLDEVQLSRPDRKQGRAILTGTD